ncbi:MAG: hypothetical protein KGN32_08505 [Burkholderiales bacterium]|nr:hypothetical protein [Burkholderiales bacterium]
MILSNPVPVDPALGLQWGLGWGIESAEGGPYLWQWGNNPAIVLSPSVLPAEHKVFRFSMVA